MAIKIEEHKTSSGIFAGCAPVEWVKQVCTDFFQTVWGKVLDTGKAIKSFLKNLFQPIGNFFSNLFGFVKPQLDSIEGFGRASYGLVLNIGKRVIQSPCGRILLASAGVVAAGVVGFYGLSYLAANAGYLIFGVPLLGRVIRGLTSTIQQAYSYNLNISDTEIKAQIKALQVRLSGAAGGAIGESLGRALCGGLTGLALMKLNPRLVIKMSEILGDEVLNEIKDIFKQLLRLTGSAFKQFAFLELFKSGRAWIQRLAKRPGMRQILPDKWEGIIANWGREGSKPWSFALAVEEKIEGIDGNRLKAFIEEGVEEFMVGCGDSMIAISYAA